MTHRLPISLALTFTVLAGCQPVKPPEPAKSPYADLGQKSVSDFLRGTIMEQVDLANAGPLRVSGYGLVVNLDGTGDTRAPNPVREYMTKQMQKHGFGSSVQKGFERIDPERVLNDKNHRTAIVRVDAFIPPGAHKGQFFDAQVSALENSNTTSLHRGQLYETDLAPRGADPFNPGGGLVNPLAHVAGPIAVNPAYAVADKVVSANQKLSLRYGVVMGRAVVNDDRPLVLKLRQPERRLARQIEARIVDFFQDSNVAHAKDEGVIYLYPPEKYGTDWEHFAQVVMHLYFNADADFAAIQAKQLADMAQQQREKAPLLDISYCWEGLGQSALPAIQPLFNSDSPDVAYAAARAAAYLGDLTAQDALARIAGMSGNPFQVNAIRVLSTLPSTARLRNMIREALNAKELPVRIEAYRAMLASNDPMLITKTVQDEFAVDIVDSDGPPIIYATRLGQPRIALIGQRPKLASPSLLMAMGDRLTVMADPDRKTAQLFYRGDAFEPDTSLECVPDVGIIIARLGGESPPNEPRMHFDYTDIVGLLQKLTEQKLLLARMPDGREAPAVFELQSVPGIDDEILSAPSIQEQRPQGAATTEPAELDEAPTIK
ncbi:MAG: flagellar basal body P-ring protein FlgI [Tepidisphaeraceae bacterium]